MGEFGQLLTAHPAWGWVAVAAIFLIVELLSGSGWLLWPAGSAALVAGVVALWPSLGLPGAIAVFAALTIVTTYVGRRFLPKSLASGDNDVNDPHARIIGHHGRVATAFVAGVGRAFVDGKEWAAEVEGGGDLAVGDKIAVLAVLDGARLKVKAQ